MTELLTLEAVVGRIAGFAMNTNTRPAWKGREIQATDTFDSIRTAVKQLAETNGVLHVNMPGPTTRHFVPRNDLSIDGSYAFEFV